MHQSPDRSDSRALPSPAWDDVRYFLAVARGGSLSAAARMLCVQHSTVARRVAALEQQIGVRLFDRLPRSWALTREGEALIAFAERFEEEASTFARAAMASTGMQGTVRVSAPPAFASHFLVPRLAMRAELWPDIAFDVVSEVRIANLQRREADVAIRFMRPTEPGLAARKLGELSYGLYAAPIWLTRPEPDWRFLGYGDALGEVPHQRLLADFAGPRTFALRSNDLVALLHACRAGMGLAMLPRFIARTDGELVEVPVALGPASREIWSVVHPDVRRASRVRRIADAIAELVHANAAILM